jgi:hypothetical protein
MLQSKPANPIPGDMYYNMSTSNTYAFDGNDWIRITDHGQTYSNGDIVMYNGLVWKIKKYDASYSMYHIENIITKKIGYTTSIDSIADPRDIIKIKIANGKV